MKRFAPTGLALLAAAAPSLLAFGAPPPELTLACTNLVSGVGWQIVVDFSANTVDSSPAKITSTEISWHANDGGNYHLDRASGDLEVIFASSTGGYAIHDRCQPAS